MVPEKVRMAPGCEAQLVGASLGVFGSLCDVASRICEITRLTVLSDSVRVIDPFKFVATASRSLRTELIKLTTSAASKSSTDKTIISATPLVRRLGIRFMGLG